MTDNLVSVIVTNYNHKEYIAECLTSVFNQTYKNIELFVFDDHSTDGSQEIIEKTLKVSPFSKTSFFSNRTNLGVCMNRNQAFSKISGEFLLFIDSDNFLNEEYIRLMVEDAIMHNADIIYGNLYNFERNEYFMKSKEFTLESLLLENYIDNCSLIRVNKIKEVRYDRALNRKKLEDYDFMLNLIITNHCVPRYNPAVDLNYRVLGDSLSRNGEHGTDKYYYEVYLEILSKYEQSHTHEIIYAIKENLFTLEARLSDLINHLEKVTEYVLELQETIEQSTQKIKQLEKQLEIEKEQLQVQVEIEKEHNAQLKNELAKKEESINRAEAQLKERTKELSHLNLELQAVRSSVSYRLGNAVVKPVGRLARFAKKIIKQKFYLGRIKARIKRFLASVHGPNYYLLKMKTKRARNKNNYINPDRILVYVIYPTNGRIQTYKFVFLEALSKLVKRTIIVVNGQVQDDELANLQRFGQVEFRSNNGYDTAAFKHGILLLGKEELAKYDELLLINDTNVGPFGSLLEVFKKMASRTLDFWGITYGEDQPDFTGYNQYGFIPKHLQSYFLVVEKSMFHTEDFFNYWENLGETDSRLKAVGKHETTFTKYFEDLGYKHDALIEDSSDSAMYIHPLKMLKEGAPLVKYAAFYNSCDDKFDWQGLTRKSQIPELKQVIQTNYPEYSSLIEEIEQSVQEREKDTYILLIDGVENIVPQLTKYRVDNKIEQLKSLGMKVRKVGLSNLRLLDGEFASHIIIYRAPYNDLLVELCRLASKYGKPVLYDIDDLVFDTSYTDQLSYTQSLSTIDKANYDASVINYGKMLSQCTMGIASTESLKEELKKYTDCVLMNRNLANDELVSISEMARKQSNRSKTEVHMGYFSGSITHNENFELIKPAIVRILEENQHVYLHLVGHLDVPKELKQLKKQLITHDFVPWQELPTLIAQVDINLAPLINSVFNRAKSEIKWLEAGLLKIPTVASDIGAFSEMIQNEETGWLVKDGEWYNSLTHIINDAQSRVRISENVYTFVRKNCITDGKEDELTTYLKSGGQND